jgi:hypothetical protein
MNRQDAKVAKHRIFLSVDFGARNQVHGGFRTSVMLPRLFTPAMAFLSRPWRDWRLIFCRV